LEGFLKDAFVLEISKILAKLRRKTSVEYDPML